MLSANWSTVFTFMGSIQINVDGSLANIHTHFYIWWEFTRIFQKKTLEQFAYVCDICAGVCMTEYSFSLNFLKSHDVFGM